MFFEAISKQTHGELLESLNQSCDVHLCQQHFTTNFFKYDVITYIKGQVYSASSRVSIFI